MNGTVKCAPTRISLGPAKGPNITDQCLDLIASAAVLNDHAAAAYSGDNDSFLCCSVNIGSSTDHAPA